LGQKLKFWSKIKILVTNPKIESLVKNRGFGQKPKFWSKIEIFVFQVFRKFNFQ